MSNRKAALVMSFICPGLGQIYKREILKGGSFMMICALLILSLFFLHAPPPLLYYSGLFILLLVWLVTMVDAYVDDEFIMERERWLIWQRTLAVLPVVVISLAVVTLMILWSQDFSAANERLVNSASAMTAPDVSSPAEIRANTETDVDLNSSEFFSVQVASFRELERAEIVYYALLSKGYTVKIVHTTSAGADWHRVLVGKFASEQEAISFMPILRERAGFSDMMVRRWTTETESANPP